MLRQKLYHLDLIGWNQHVNDVRFHRFVLFVKPCRLCQAEVSLVGATGPFFGPAIQAPPVVEMQDDMAVFLAGKGGIPFGRVRRFVGDTQLAQNPVQDVVVGDIGCENCKNDCDENGCCSSPVFGRRRLCGCGLNRLRHLIGKELGKYGKDQGLNDTFELDVRGVFVAAR